MTGFYMKCKTGLKWVKRPLFIFIDYPLYKTFLKFTFWQFLAFTFFQKYNFQLSLREQKRHEHLLTLQSGKEFLSVLSLESRSNAIVIYTNIFDAIKNQRAG